MKTKWNNLSPLLRVLIYFAVMQLATVIAGSIPDLNSLWFFFVVSLALSWLFLFLEGSSVWSLNAIPRKKIHWLQLLRGTLIGIAMLLITAVITLKLTGAEWQPNKHFSLMFLPIALAGCLWSAYVQEFVFRGYPFQTLLRRYHFWLAQLLIAIPFGLMHVHSSMTYQEFFTTMLTTGLGSILFGLAYQRTGNLMFPVGLHFGWNYAQLLLPRSSDQGSGLLLISHSSVSSPFLPFVAPYLVIIVIVILYLYRMPEQPTATNQTTYEK